MTPRFKCGHAKTPENTAKMGQWTRCLRCKRESNNMIMKRAREQRCLLALFWEGVKPDQMTEV